MNFTQHAVHIKCLLFMHLIWLLPLRRSRAFWFLNPRFVPSSFVLKNVREWSEEIDWNQTAESDQSNLIWTWQPSRNIQAITASIIVSNLPTMDIFSRIWDVVGGTSPTSPTVKTTTFCFSAQLEQLFYFTLPGSRALDSLILTDQRPQFLTF